MYVCTFSCKQEHHVHRESFGNIIRNHDTTPRFCTFYLYYLLYNPRSSKSRRVFIRFCLAVYNHFSWMLLIQRDIFSIFRVSLQVANGLLYPSVQGTFVLYVRIIVCIYINIYACIRSAYSNEDRLESYTQYGLKPSRKCLVERVNNLIIELGTRVGINVIECSYRYFDNVKRLN